MSQAETYTELHAACPECGHPQEVEFVDEFDNELSKHTCEECNKEFSYCHPQNQHGLAI